MKCPNCGDDVGVHSEADCIHDFLAAKDRELAHWQAEVARRDVECESLRANVRKCADIIGTYLPHGQHPGDVDAWSTAMQQLKEARARVALLEHERDAYRAMVCDLVASAHPHPIEHPTMTRQWERAKDLLANGPAEQKPGGER